MSYLLTDPDSVVVVGESVSRDELRTTLDGDTDAVEDVVGIDSVGALADRSQRDDVGCVVVLEADAVEDALAVVREGENGARLPVVAYVEGDADVAATAAERAGCRYLPRAAGAKALQAAVVDALGTYERRRRERAESSLFTTLLAEGQLSIFAKDDEGRHLYMADKVGTTDPDDGVGKTDVDLVHPDAEATAREAYEDDLAVVESGEPIYEKLESYRFGGGHTHWSEVTKIPWRLDGETQGLVGFAADVNRRKQYERRLEQQSERIDRFMSYVSHDLRTPVQIIYGNIDRVRAGNVNALDTVEEAADRIDTIVDDLGELAKGDRESGLASNTLRQLDAEALTTDLVPLLEELWSVVAPDSATLTVELPDETVVGASAETLRPVFENLFKNAVEHAGPDVTVRVGATDTGGVFVADDGPGIPESDRDRVTEVGYSTSDEGTGTGLDIVGRTVDQKRWDLHVTESAEGGARFAIEGVPTVTRTPFDGRPVGAVELVDSTDVGPVSKPGSASHDPDTDRWTVTANGRNVWGDVHEFHYVHGTATPPVRLEGRILELDGSEEFSKAGFAIRAGTEPSAPFGYVGTTEAHGSEVTWRETADGFTDSDQFEEFPETFEWYRVEYVDGVVTCSLSESGDRFHPVDQRVLDLGDTVSVGLMVCSHSKRQTCEATFADVRAMELDVE